LAQIRNLLDDHFTLKTKNAVLLAVFFQQLVVPFMMSGIAVAIPSIGRDFGAGGNMLALLESSYIGAVAAFLLPFGRLSDMVGRGGIFIYGQILFTLATIALGLSPNTTSFIVFRILQGIGGAMFVSTGLAILTEAFPVQERGRAFGIAIAAVYLGLSMGPTLCGMITTHFGWRFVFFIGIPACLVSICISFSAVERKIQKSSASQFDWQGTLLSAAGIGLFVTGGTFFGLLLGKIALAMCLLLFIAFVVRQYGSAAPLVDMRHLLGNRTYLGSSLSLYINYSAIFGITFLISVFLQNVYHMTAMQAGLIIMVQALVQSVSSPVAGRLADRWPAHRIAALGAGMCAIGLFVLTMVVRQGSGPNLWPIIVAMVIEGAGVAAFAASNTKCMMNSVPQSRNGEAGAMNSLMRSSGMMTSMVLITIVLGMVMGHDVEITPSTSGAYTKAMHMILAVFTFLCFLATFVSAKSIDSPPPVDTLQ
jgi:EmrB/QacA subfamily drug resistance transporter